MIKGKKIVLFDMDGTLIDSVGIWNEVDCKLIAQIGQTQMQGEEVQAGRDAVLRKFSTEPNPYLKYCGYLKEKYACSLAAEEILHQRYQIADDYLKNEIDYKKDVEKVLRKLRDCGLKLIIATTTQKANMDIYRTKNRNIMGKAPLNEFFSIIYTREDVKEIKPNPEIYCKILKELDVTPEDCIIFEDSLIGIEAANNAGIEVAAIYDKYSDHERSQINQRANYYFEDYAAVLKAINEELHL